MKAHKFSATFFDTDERGNRIARFEAGKHYPIDEETTRCVARGIAAEIDVPDEPEQAEQDAAPAKRGRK